MLPQPVVNAGTDKSIIAGGSVVLDASATGAGLQYQWTPATGINNSMNIQPTASPVQDVLDTLTVNAADGCSASGEVMVKVYKNVFVPTAFSPNNDGFNDRWRIPFLESYASASIEVFNRFGKMVYHSTGGPAGWDGKFKGKLLPMASYCWILHLGEGKKTLYGMVTIVQ